MPVDLWTLPTSLDSGCREGSLHPPQLQQVVKTPTAPPNKPLHSCAHPAKTPSQAPFELHVPGGAQPWQLGKNPRMPPLVTLTLLLTPSLCLRGNSSVAQHCLPTPSASLLSPAALGTRGTGNVGTDEDSFNEGTLGREDTQAPAPLPSESTEQALMTLFCGEEL